MSNSKENELPKLLGDGLVKNPDKGKDEKFSDKLDSFLSHQRGREKNINFKNRKNSWRRYEYYYCSKKGTCNCTVVPAEEK